jgi:hypothetical protein
LKPPFEARKKQNALPEQLRKGAMMNENVNPSGQRTSGDSIVAIAATSMRHEPCSSDRNIGAVTLPVDRRIGQLVGGISWQILPLAISFATMPSSNASLGNQLAEVMPERLDVDVQRRHLPGGYSAEIACPMSATALFPSGFVLTISVAAEVLVWTIGMNACGRLGSSGPMHGRSATESEALESNPVTPD